MKKLLTLWILSSLLFHCEEITHQELKSANDSFLVVDGGITNENATQEIKLSLTFADLGQTAPPVTDALVLVNDGNTNFIFTHDDTRPGTYQNDSLRALFGRAYILYILYREQEYFAVATSAIGTPLPELVLEEQTDGGWEYIHNDPIPSMTYIQATWIENGTEQKKEGFFYTLDIVDITQTFAPDKAPFTFPKGATLTRKKYSLTEEHQNFLRSFLAEVDWRGGPFDAAPGNVLTNMSAGALGYFYVAMVDTDMSVIN